MRRKSVRDRSSACISGYLDCFLEQRLMAQMQAIKITYRDHTQGVLFGMKTRFSRLRARASAARALSFFLMEGLR